MKGRINPDFLPPAGGKILLHSCCAPCSAAVMEELLRMGADFSVFYFNPNIFPLQEYELRKSENKKLALSMGAPFIDADWTHSEWSAQCSPLAAEPERGRVALNASNCACSKRRSTQAQTAFRFSAQPSRRRAGRVRNRSPRRGLLRNGISRCPFLARNWLQGRA